MRTLTPRRALRLGVLLLLLGLPALLAAQAGHAVWSLFDQVDPAAPYFSGLAPGLLYVALPLVVLSSLVLVMTPGLLLAAALGRPDSPEEWLLKGFALSVVVLGAATAAVQAVLGRPLVGTGFVTLASTCSLAAAVLAWWRAKRDPFPLPSCGLGYLAALVGVPLLFLVALIPKFFWEGFNGDGAHAYEATRLLLFQSLPFWPEGAGNAGAYPGMNSLLYLLPGSWFLRLFGEIEASTRLPYLLFMGLLFAAVVGVAREARREHLRFADYALIWMGIVSFSLVMAYSATYDPYCSDIGLPATQDALLLACFLGLVLAFLRDEKGWMVLWSAFTLLCSPAGPLLLGAWLAAVVLTFRPRPWRRIGFLCGGVAACMALMAAAPALLAQVGLPAPGQEHATGALLSKFRYVLPTDFRRLLFLVLPCGVYPALALIQWRRADDAARALLVVTLLVFGIYYLMAFVSLHYFVPAMVLPLAIFWRSQRTVEWKLGLPAVAACAGLALFAIVVALPRSAAIYTGTRTVGASLDASRLEGYEHMDASYFRGMQLLEDLFVPGWGLDVPQTAYAGAALSWSFYAQRAPRDEQETTYVLANAKTPAPKGALRVATDGEASLWVLDEDCWESHRTMQPAGSRGHSVYAVPRDLLFRRQRAFERYRIIDVKGLISRRDP